MSTKAEGLAAAIERAYRDHGPRSSEFYTPCAAAICDELGITREMVEHLYHGRAGSKNEAVNALSTLLDVAGR